MKQFIVTGILLGLVLAGFAQEEEGKVSKRQERKREKRERISELMKLEEEGIPPFQKQHVFGAKLNTDGWGVSYEFGRANTPRRATIYQVEFNDKRHRKEKRNTKGIEGGGGFIFFGNPFVYGKQNSFYQVKMSMGQQVMIGAKGNKNGVAVYGIAAGGVSLGMERPYYVELKQNTGINKRYVKYDSPDSLLFMSEPAILGRAGLSKGWNEMKLAPGLHAKAALRFDYNRFNNKISALEAGINAEFYFRKIEQMVYNPGNRFFMNAYISLLFGKRK